jgi:type III secretory pathway component EscT
LEIALGVVFGAVVAASLWAASLAERETLIESAPGAGTEVRFTVPKSHPGVRAA